MHILVPFDVQPVSERAVRTAVEMFRERDDVRITAVHVSPREEAPAQIAASEIETIGEDHGVDVDADIRLVDHGSESKAAVRKAITEVVEEEAVDLVVVGHEAKSLFEQLFRSDTTERLLETNETPVLLVP